MGIAHINKSGKIQTVSEHSSGVKIKAAAYAEKINACRIAELAGLIHDTGKLCNDFEKYIKHENSIKRGDIDHCFAGAKLLCTIADSMGNNYYNVSRFIAHTIVSHHGLHDWYNDKGEDYFKKRISRNERYDEILNNLAEVTSEEEIKNLLIQANEEYRAIRQKIYRICGDDEPKNVIKRMAFYMGLFERLIQSVLIDADRTDTADFMSETQTEISFTDDELQNIWKNMSDNLEEKIAGFADKTDVISLQRRSISKRCKTFAKNKAGICRLIVPTGGGKTLSSLRFAVNSCIEHGMSKIFYIAPYMSILEQNSSEIRSIAGEEYFIEHHSNAFIDENNAEELAEYELRTEKWDLPVVATTMVQFLNFLFSGKMQAVRRMHRLMNSVIIIDEVQSVPLKCVNIFNLAMNFLSAVCGCTIVLCSATQPVFENTEYPLLLDGNQSMTGDYTEDFEIFKRTEIVPEIENYGMTYEETAEFCRREYEKAGNLLVIVNTKNSARRIYEIMKEMSYSLNPEIIHLSTNMCPEHRYARIKEIRENTDKPLICITTQLIEAGVDISFKCVIRSLAGLDNIAQAAGRCNRHGENSELCPVYIIDIKDENLDKLREIKRAKSISRDVIASYSDCDLSSPEILAKYYELLFREAKNELDYNIDDKQNTDLIDLLSLNENSHNKSLNSKDYSKSNNYLAQAFRTAGDSFDVIDAETIGIIVPYNNEAINIINALESDIEPEKARGILRKSQKYTVSVYQGMFRILVQNEAVRRTASKTNPVYVLKAEYYDMELGIKTESSLMDFLDY